MLPRVQPIAPIRRPEPFDDPEWVFDVKYDGFRGICYLEQGSCRMISRNGNPMMRFAALGRQIAAALDVSDAILDGEVIAADETGRPQFYDLGHPPMWLSMRSGSTALICRRLPLTERRRHLRNILPKGSAIISEALSGTGAGHKLFELMCVHDLEGVVAKRLEDGYGSRARWLKIKNRNYSQNEGRRELFDRSSRRLRPYLGQNKLASCACNPQG